MEVGRFDHNRCFKCKCKHMQAFCLNLFYFSSGLALLTSMLRRIMGIEKKRTGALQHAKTHNGDRKNPTGAIQHAYEGLGCVGRARRHRTTARRGSDNH